MNLAHTRFLRSLLLLLAYNDRYSMNTPQSPADMLGKRSWRDLDMTRPQRLEVQLNLKDKEINRLREQLTRLTSTTRMAETNMAAQESMIMSLQLRQETEKAAKLKAMMALSERTKNLEACSTEKKKLESDLDGCHSERGL